MSATAAARHRDDERGFVLVWFAVMLVVLIAIGGLAVDFSHWFQVGSQEQKAADAAALAGAVFLPDNPTQAISTANTIAAKNGFSSGVVALPGADGHPDQMKVTITTTVSNFLSSVIGFKQETITKTATGEYTKPVAMGSPTNQYGNDPESSGTPGSPTYPNLWASIAGPANPKMNGDAYAAGDCSNGPDLCTGNPPPDRSCGYAGNNSDFSCTGYDYTVHEPAGGASFQIQAFDAGFVDVGNNCGANDDGSNLTGAAGLTAAQVKGWPGVSPAPSTRYLPVADATKSNDPGLRYCTGDNTDGDQNITTTYTVLGPASIPGDVNSVPSTPVCTKSYPAVFGDLKAALTSNTKIAVTTNGSASPEFLGQYFRQWDNLCPSNVSGSGGDYFVRVQTNLTTGGGSNTIGNGHNRFALKATNSGVEIYGNAKMGAYADAAGGLLTEFYLARLTPGTGGRTLDLRLFDIGDASAAGTLTIKPPTDATNTLANGQTVALSSFSGCTYQLGTGASFGPTGSGCSIGSVISSSYNGKWLTVKVPIPDAYNCNFTSPSGCWVKIDYQFPSQIDDTTSWTASIDGDPVRLIH